MARSYIVRRKVAGCEKWSAELAPPVTVPYRNHSQKRQARPLPAILPVARLVPERRSGSAAGDEAHSGGLDAIHCNISKDRWPEFLSSWFSAAQNNGPRIAEAVASRSNDTSCNW